MHTWLNWIKLDSYSAFSSVMWLETPLHQLEISLRCCEWHNPFWVYIRALVVLQTQHTHFSFSYEFLHHASQFLAVLYNHLHILKELQIWLLALTVSCKKFASHYIKTELMVSLTGKWSGKEAFGDQQWN